MGWLALGAAYSIIYAIVGAYLRPYPEVVPWFRIVALLLPPLAGVAMIARRRHMWAGCQWLFWATLALGLLMSGISVIGWSVDEMMLGIGTSWLGWHAVFALFGGGAPLLSELQQFLVCIGMAIAAIFTPDPEWKQVYRRLAIGLCISFITLTLSNAEIWQGFYQSASLGDAMWILPFAFYPWAAADAPKSNISAIEADEAQAATSRPWVIFAGLALLPLIDFGLRRAVPAGAFAPFQDLSMAGAIVSVLPLLMARVARQRAEPRPVGAK